MELAVRRIWQTPETPFEEGATTGVLEADGKHMCYTLEDEVREISGLDVGEWKIPGRTAIPRGRYRVVMDFSNRFGRIMPHILDVPGFAGIRFHGGNKASDVEGCIALGRHRNDERTISECEPACRELCDLILAAIANQELVYVTVT